MKHEDESIEKQNPKFFAKYILSKIFRITGSVLQAVQDYFTFVP